MSSIVYVTFLANMFEHDYSTLETFKKQRVRVILKRREEEDKRGFKSNMNGKHLYWRILVLLYFLK